jgi:hypothetical protein
MLAKRRRQLRPMRDLHRHRCQGLRWIGVDVVAFQQHAAVLVGSMLACRRRTCKNASRSRSTLNNELICYLVLPSIGLDVADGRHQGDTGERRHQLARHRPRHDRSRHQNRPRAAQDGSRRENLISCRRRGTGRRPARDDVNPARDRRCAKTVSRRRHACMGAPAVALGIVDLKAG